MSSLPLLQGRHPPYTFVLAFRYTQLERFYLLLREPWQTTLDSIFEYTNNRYKYTHLQSSLFYPMKTNL